jgi:hypothetical protein
MRAIDIAGFEKKFRAEIDPLGLYSFEVRTFQTSDSIASLRTLEAWASSGTRLRDRRDCLLAK